VQEYLRPPLQREKLECALKFVPVCADLREVEMLDFICEELRRVRHMRMGLSPETLRSSATMLPMGTFSGKDSQNSPGEEGEAMLADKEDDANASAMTDDVQQFAAMLDSLQEPALEALSFLQKRHRTDMALAALSPGTEANALNNKPPSGSKRFGLSLRRMHCELEAFVNVDGDNGRGVSGHGRELAVNENDESAVLRSRLLALGPVCSDGAHILTGQIIHNSYRAIMFRSGLT